MVRVLASHHFFLDSIPGFGVICGLRMLTCWFSSLLREVFLDLRILRFSPLLKQTKTSKFQFDLECPRLKLCTKYMDTSIKLHILLFYFLSNTPLQQYPSSQQRCTHCPPPCDVSMSTLMLKLKETDIKIRRRRITHSEQCAS